MSAMTTPTYPLLNLLFGDRGTKVFFGMLLATVIMVPALHLAVPEGSTLHVSSYTMTLIGKYMTYALLAIAVDLVWGYCGILSLGHAAFFACPRSRLSVRSSSSPATR